MPRKVKPRWGWDDTHNGKDCDARMRRIDDEVVKKILGSINPESDPSFGNAITSFLHDLYWEAFEIPDPNSKEIEAALQGLRASAEKFGFCIENLDRLSRNRLGYEFNQVAKEIAEPSERNKFYRYANMMTNAPMDALKMTKVLASTIEQIEFLAETPKKRGRKPNVAIKNFIYSLSIFLETHSGDDPLTGFYHNAIQERYEGPLVRLSEYFLGQFAPEMNITNASIGEYIRRTIGDRSK